MHMTPLKVCIKVTKVVAALTLLQQVRSIHIAINYFFVFMSFFLLISRFIFVIVKRAYVVFVVKQVQLIVEFVILICMC